MSSIGAGQSVRESICSSDDRSCVAQRVTEGDERSERKGVEREVRREEGQEDSLGANEITEKARLMAAKKKNGYT